MKSMEEIAIKIQKLLSLAGNNPDETEAQQALLKAQELMAKYNMEQDELSGKPEYKYDLIESKVKQHKYNNSLATIIANSFACKVIMSNGKLTFFGRADNAQAAVSAMEFAYSVMKKGRRKVAKENGVYHKEGQANYQNSYMLGFLRGLKSAMDAQTVALAIVVPKDVKDKFAERFPVLGKTRASHTKQAYGREAYEAGIRDGSTVMNKRSLPA